MYSVTMEINQRCNMKCSYCYLGEKNGTVMPWVVAKNSVDFVFANAKIHSDKKIIFDFIGGEPLLDFGLIKQIVKYVNEKNKLYLYNIEYGVTTNGTLLTKEIAEWLASENFNLKISIDGKAEVTNMGRGNGTDVYSKIMQNWENIILYKKIACKNVQVTNVITKENYKFYYDSFLHLIEQLKIKTIFTVLDISVNWSAFELECIGRQIEKAYQYFIEKIRMEPFYWHFITQVKDAIKVKKRFYSCGAGIVSSYVKVNGDIYACANAVQCKATLGNVHSGYDKQAISYLKNITEIDNKKCISCSIYELCSAKGCIYKSILENGNVNHPSYALCWMQKFKFSFYNNHKKEIDNLYMLQKEKH